MIQTFLYAIGGLIALAYALPLVTTKLNIANVGGIMYGAALIICSIFIKSYIADTILIIQALFLIPFFATLLPIIRIAKSKPAPNSTVIVLGCRVKGDKPSLSLIERCRTAEKYLANNKNAIAIVSGGQGDDELISEADCMAELMSDYSDRIIKENRSTSTHENLLYSKSIIEQMHLNDNIAIASSEYHLYRAGMIAEEIGFSNISFIPSRTKWYCRHIFYTREVIGVWAKKLNIKN